MEWVYLIVLVFFVFGGGDQLLKHLRQMKQLKIDRIKEQRKLEQQEFDHKRQLEEQRFRHDQELYEQHRLTSSQWPQLTSGNPLPQPPAKPLPDPGTAATGDQDLPEA